MANTTSNIIVGAAEIAVGTGTPTVAGIDATWNALKTAVSTGKNYRGWVNSPTTINGIVFSDVGLTQEGVEIQYQPDYGEVEVDQLLDAARLFKQKMTVTVATTLAEATLENLVLAWDDSVAPVGTTEKSVYFKPGNLGDAPQEKHIVFVGPAPGAVGAGATAQQRIYLASRAVSMEASTHALRRNEATVFPVTFRLLPDTNSSFSAYGKIVDITG